ncbi:unnamed protein product [Brachionus calyciflorus]|uniref:Ubiquitin carboxyl-terminal hydrolase n=1 Tax=Brachionus calyciflorus TaxID=104777 RepID=A0A813NFW3_9BILA|nr:unnamed protein product [Brachionus calyciflorus]
MVAKEDLIPKSNDQKILNYIRNDITQSGNKISWYLYIKEIISEFTQVDFTETSCKIRFKTKDPLFLKQNNSTEMCLFEWNVDLYDRINAEECSFKISNFKIEITLIIINRVSWPSISPNQKQKQTESKANDQKIVKNRSPSSSPSPPPQPKIKPVKTTNNYGYVGLANLGNTCYMNAALQFLVNATDLRDYFLVNKEQFQKEINMNNALGLNGKMAISFAILLRQLWTADSSYIIPNKLRDLICSKYSNFRGYEQQDTQEFMSSLISLIHEDLNRVLKKPFYEDSLECEEDSLANCKNIAAKSWDRFLSRENSIIVDNFYGQFKSTLTCPECNRVSITFEPFSNLLVPLAKPKIPIDFLISIEQHLDLINLYLNEETLVENSIDEIKNKFTEFKDKNLKLCVIEKFTNETLDDEYSGFVFDSNYDNLKNSEKLPSLRKNAHFMIVEIEEPVNDDVYEFRVEQACKFPILNYAITECSYCLKMNEQTTSLPRCTKCYRSAYCNQECQKSDWKKHSESICIKPSDRIGLPFLINLKKSQLKSENFYQELKKILIEKSLKSLELKNFDLSKNSIFELEMLDSSAKPKYQKIDPNNLWELVEKSNKKMFKLILKWNNNSIFDRTIKTNLNNIVEISQENQTNEVDLDDCLKLFTQPEKLTSDNPWYCSKCKKHQEATKQMSLWKLPKYLIVTLKRFQASKAADLDPTNEAAKFMMMNSRFSYLLQNRVVYNKLNHFVNFPLQNLNMNDYLVNREKENCVYDLCGVINHIGHSLSVGHYTAYARTHDKVDTTEDELSWRLFDDQDVCPVKDGRQVVSKDAYVLMYRLRTRPANVNDHNEKENTKNDDLNLESNNLSSESVSEEEFYDVESEESIEFSDKNNYTNLNEID